MSVVDGDTGMREIHEPGLSQAFAAESRLPAF